MSNFLNNVKANHADGLRFFFHGSSHSVVSQLRDGDMEVNQTFHVTDDPLVAAAYAGAKGSVLVIGVADAYGAHSKITLCQRAAVNGSNQWIMSAHEANEMLTEADEAGALHVSRAITVLTQ